MEAGAWTAHTAVMLNWFLQLRRASLVRDPECDAAALCVGVVLLALGVALL